MDKERKSAERVEKARKVVEKSGKPDRRITELESEAIMRLAGAVVEGATEECTDEVRVDSSQDPSNPHSTLTSLLASVNQAVPRQTQGARRKRPRVHS